MFYISTSWNFRQHAHAKGIVEEIKKAGAFGVELNFNLDRALLKEFALLKKNGEVDIISLHNYCPLPEGVDPKKASPDFPSLSSLDEAERREALKFTKTTIDSALELGARVVILHMGRVEVKDRTIKLSRLEKGTPVYAGLKARMETERQLLARPYFENALRSLEELEPYAGNKGISLGIENRYYFRELPSFGEIGRILDHFGDSGIYYWHDIGHAKTQECIGFGTHDDYLRSFSRKLIGIHLHDIIGVDDHRIPGAGNFDFTVLRPYVKKGTVKVIEAHQPATVDDMTRGAALLKNIFREE